jgi:hypothetical protein
MHDAGKVMVGLVIFLAVVTSPVWSHALKGTAVGAPELTIGGESTVCVAETSYMRSLHMDLLNDWRDEAVRDGDRVYVGLGGVEYDKSIGGTCLESCHSNREEFCDRCHEYVGEEVTCWECHTQQKADLMVEVDRIEIEKPAGLKVIELASGVAAKPLSD